MISRRTVLALALTARFAHAHRRPAVWTGNDLPQARAGCRQRGARDNRFSFKIARKGTPVKIIDAPDVGG